MINNVKIALIVVFALLAQVTLFPAYLADPFKPNLLVIFVVHMGLRGSVRWGVGISFLLGLLQDTFSGLYPGLTAFSYLVIFILVKSVADRLYTDSRVVMVLGAFLATVVNGLLNLLLLLLFSAAGDLYLTLIPALIPQGVVNALAASLWLWFSPRRPAEAR